MFCRTCLDDIRWSESSLYQGAETAEKVFEREESFQGPHARRRNIGKRTTVSSDISENKEIWYKIYYNSDEKKVVREFYPKEEK